MTENKSKWLRLNSGHWQIIVPESDIKPHGFPNGKKIIYEKKLCVE